VRTRLVATGLAALSLAAIASPAQAGLKSLRPCGPRTAALCGTVDAPLDPSGRHPGTVRLYVEELKAAGLGPNDAPGKTIFLIAGGPGQGSASAFDLSGSGSDTQALFPGYTLVAFDDRGTGRSGPLECRGIDAALTASPNVAARIIGRCGRELGPTRVFYSTRNHAEDVETVRRALGLGRIALYGTSYGTTEALVYAAAHPAQVQRLVLDSIAPANSRDPFYLDTARAIPHALASICHGGACRALTGDPGRDFARLANRLAARPLIGTVPRPGARRRTSGSTEPSSSRSPSIPTSTPGLQPACPRPSARRSLDGRRRWSD
jgi:pimeloyl-ACP methyl ester carboxylesterase